MEERETSCLKGDNRRYLTPSRDIDRVSLSTEKCFILEKQDSANLFSGILSLGK